VQLQQQVNDAVGGFGQSVAEVKKKWVCRESQTKRKEAAVKRQNRSSKVKTGAGISKQCRGGKRSGQSNYLVVLKSKYRKHLQVNPVIDCDICLVLSPTKYLNDFMRHLRES